MQKSFKETKRRAQYPIGDGKVMHLRDGQRINNDKLFIKRIVEERLENGLNYVYIYASNDNNEIRLWKTIVNGMTVLENDLGILFDE